MSSQLLVLNKLRLPELIYIHIYDGLLIYIAIKTDKQLDDATKMGK